MNGKQLKNSILQWAIQGKLVPQDPNDEPASVLLEKIRQEKERLIKEKKIKRDKNASIIYRGEDNSYYEKMLATGEVKCIDEEVPFEIPTSWNWARLASITSILGDGIHGTPEYDAIGTVYFINGNNLSNGSIEIKADTKKVSEQEAEKHKRLLNSTTVLVSINGTLGNVAFYNGENVILGKSACYFNLMGNIDKQYIKHILETEYFIEYAKNVATGSTIKNVPLAGMRNFLIPVPPITEQHRIIQGMVQLAHSIDRYNGAQTKLDLLNNVLNKKLKKSVLQEAIQGKLVPQIAEEGTAQELLEQIKAEKQKLFKEGKLKKSALATSVIFRGDDNKYWEKKGTTCECIDEDIPFDVPKSWAWVRLETILNIGSARRVHAKDWRQAGIPFYRAREIGKLADDGFVDNELYIDLSLYEDFSSSGVPLPNDLMITAVGTLGKVYIVKESDRFYYKDGSVLCLANKYRLCAEYLKMVIESPFFKGQYRQESQGTTVATLTMVRLQKYFIPIPPLQEQYRIVETYRNIASIMSR